MPALADRLAGLDRAALGAFFSDHDAVEVTRLIHECSDEELGRLVADDAVRAEAVLGILRRFPEFADHERLAAIDGVARFDLTREKGPNECHTVRFSGGA